MGETWEENKTLNSQIAPQNLYIFNFINLLKAISLKFSGELA